LGCFVSFFFFFLFLSVFSIGQTRKATETNLLLEYKKKTVIRQVVDQGRTPQKQLGQDQGEEEKEANNQTKKNCNPKTDS